MHPASKTDRCGQAAVAARALGNWMQARQQVHGQRPPCKQRKTSQTGTAARTWSPVGPEGSEEERGTSAHAQNACRTDPNNSNHTTTGHLQHPSSQTASHGQPGLTQEPHVNPNPGAASAAPRRTALNPQPNCQHQRPQNTNLILQKKKENRPPDTESEPLSLKQHAALRISKIQHTHEPLHPRNQPLSGPQKTHREGCCIGASQTTSQAQHQPKNTRTLTFAHQNLSPSSSSNGRMLRHNSPPTTALLAPGSETRRIEASKRKGN